MDELKKAAVEFYEEHAKCIDEKKNIWSVNATDYKKFFKKQGIPEETLKKVVDIEAALINGGNVLLKNKTVEAIKKAKENGDDPKQIKVICKTATPSGRIVQTMDAHRQYHDPRNPGKSINAYGVITLRVINNRLIDSDITSEAAKAVEAAI
jgi:hypothetical protein